MKNKKYNGLERRSQALVFGCLEMHARYVGEFFRGLLEAAEVEKQKILKEMKDD